MSPIMAEPASNHLYALVDMGRSVPNFCYSPILVSPMLLDTTSVKAVVRPAFAGIV